MDFNVRFESLQLGPSNATAPLANYVPYVRTGNLLFISGQVPIKEGKMVYQGRLGETLSIEDGYQAARLCAINVLANVRAACNGDLNAVVRCVRLGGFVASANDFYDQPKVVNGASDLMVEVFDAAGRHARSAVAVNALPFNAAVEVEAVFELR